MRKMIVFLLFALLMNSSLVAGMIAVPVLQPAKSKPVNTTVSVLQQMDAATFLTLTPQKWQEMTGKKISFTQKLSLKMAQKQVKRQLKNGKAVDMATVARKAAWGDNFHWGAFLLGMFLGPIGVLIVYLVEFEDPQIARKSAWRGLLTWLALALLVTRLIVGF